MVEKNKSKKTPPLQFDHYNMPKTEKGLKKFVASQRNRNYVILSRKEHEQLTQLSKAGRNIVIDYEEFRIPNWGLAGENYERVKPNARGYRPQRRDEYADDRVFPIVAIPKSTTIAQLENLHGWAKGWTAPETFRITKYRHLYAEQLRVKPQYMKNLKKEVAKLHGFFLVEKKEAKA